MMRFRRFYFSIIELMMAITLILFMSNYLVRMFIGTLDITQLQVGNHIMYNQAVAYFSILESDLKSAMTRGIYKPSPSGPSTSPHVGMYLDMADNADTFPAAAGGWPRLNFVATFGAARVDRMLSVEGASAGGAYYDGWVANTSNLYPTGGLREVGYFLRPSPDAPITTGGVISEKLYTLCRQERAPVTVNGEFNTQGTLKYDPKRELAGQVIYAGYRFMIDKALPMGIMNGTDIKDTWSGTPDSHPHFIEATISFGAQTSSAQQQGQVINGAGVSAAYDSTTVPGMEGIISGGSSITVKMSGTNFKQADQGYMAVLGRGVLYYNLVSSNGKSYTFMVVKVPGSPASINTSGATVYIGTTFKRMIEVGR